MGARTLFWRRGHEERWTRDAEDGVCWGSCSARRLYLERWQRQVIGACLGNIHGHTAEVNSSLNIDKLN
ncbi:hypothetical protein chiPu_0005412 [Chiloscyllium punctatum]|uniref:Uncharacterized protein n=1 Tax=Chiloscyllium punctatum TaxID=137246 RepID=A0A401S9C0_CHIPU|nr:hypothetical protein [Chiloscyllium punctatum]